MDQYDHAILQIVQDDCSLGYAAIAEEVGLSASAVRRRLVNLKRSGVIIAERAIVDPSHIGVTLIVSVTLDKENTATYRRFKTRFARVPEIAQCYIVTGQADFVLVAHFGRMEDYEAWLDEHLLCEPTIKRVETNVVYSRVKFETAVSTVRLTGP